MNHKRFWIIALLGVFAPPDVQAASVSIVASKDNSIYQSNANNSAGGAAGIFVGANGQASLRRGLLAFDIAANVPAGSTITSAQLTLYTAMTPNSNSVNIELHKLTKDWGEGSAGSSSPAASGGGQGFTASPGDATWSDAKLGSVAWTNPGANGDFVATTSGSTAVTGPVDTPFTWSSTAGLIADVQNWLGNPASNFGWTLINASEGTNSVKAFYTREATQNSTNVPNSLDPTWRPTLTVTFVPEPAGAWMILVGASPLFFPRRYLR
jgi:hypothetical protein